MPRHNGGPMGDHREVLHGNHLIPREPNAYVECKRSAAGGFWRFRPNLNTRFGRIRNGF